MKLDTLAIHDVVEIRHGKNILIGEVVGIQPKETFPIICLIDNSFSYAEKFTDMSQVFSIGRYRELDLPKSKLWQHKIYPFYEDEIIRIIPEIKWS